MRLFPLLFLFCVLPGMAFAGPVGAAVMAFSGTSFGSFLIKTAVSIGLNYLASRLLKKKKPKQQQQGIRSGATTAGGTIPQSIIFGRYATGGTAVCPPMTHGRDGRLIDYLTYVIDVGDYPITAIDAVYIDAKRSVFTSPGNIYGATATNSPLSNKAWLRWYDGKQTAADDMLVRIYSGYVRPWTSEFILTGSPYAILTFKFDENEYNGMPECLFEVRGAKLYDPRKDPSVGGSGGQFFNQPETWEFTENPVVMVYNLLRGLTLPDGSVYGVRVPASNLPIDRWIAAMNVCDVVVPSPGGPEPLYKAGYEFSVEDEPLDVIDELLAACGGQIAECGGIWNVTCGSAGMPRGHFTDDDVIISNERDFRPFRGLNETFNGANAVYPSPDTLWKAKDAPPLRLPALEAIDDGRQLIASMNLSMVTSGYQAQRLMIETIADNRRMVSHSLTLRPTAMGLLPLDTISWTSAANGYINKLFEIVNKTIDPSTLNITLNLRERDASDYEYDYSALVPVFIPDFNRFEDGTDENAGTDDDYMDPETGNPLTGTVRPAIVSATLVAVHDAAVSYSTNGGHSWTRYNAPFQGGADISALAGGGYVVRTESGEAWFSRDLQNWQLLDVQDTTATNVLTNGGFEEGNLDNWILESGTTPLVLSTSTPEQRGGDHYVESQAAFRIGQGFDKSGLPASLIVSADFWIPNGIEGRVGIKHFSDTAVPTGASSFSGNRIVNYARSPLNERLDFVVVSGSKNGLNNNGSTGTRIIEIQKTDGSVYAGKVYVSFYDIDIGIESVTTPTGNVEEVIIPSGGVTVSTSSGKTILTPTSNNSNAGIIFKTGNIEFLLELNASTVNISIPPTFRSDLMPIEFSDSTSNLAGLWENVSFKAANNSRPFAFAFVEANGPGAYVDNVKVIAGAEEGAQALAITHNVSARRHVVATASSLFTVDAIGALESLGTLPFAPEFIAASSAELAIAAGTDVAFSSDNGAFWATFTAPQVITHLVYGEGRFVATGATGGVYTVGSGGVGTESTLPAQHYIDPAARFRAFFAVDTDTGAVRRGSLSSLNDAAAPDMPIGALLGSYRVTATDQGRVVGWREGYRDVFNLDRDAAAWTISPVFTSEIKDLKEVK